MKENNAIKTKSFNFSVRIVKMGQYLIKRTSYPEHKIITQIIKSGTSIGANIRESEYAESPDDFVHKLRIALKETNETEYWLDILYHCEYITEEQYNSLIIDCKEVLKLLISIINKLTNK